MQRGFSATVGLQRVYFALAVLLLICGVSTSSWALNDSDKEAVRSLSNEAAADYAGGRYDEARDKFARAYTIARVPKLAVWLARSNEQLGKLVAAYEYYRQAISLQREDFWVGETQEEAQREAVVELAKLTPRLCRVTVAVQGIAPNEATVRVDGNVVPAPLLGVERFVDPGLRDISASTTGQVVRKTPTLREGERAQIVLKFDSASQPYRSPAEGAVIATGKNKPNTNGSQSTSATLSQEQGSGLRTVGWASLGAGAAGIVTGAVTGALVANRYHELKDLCGKNCGSAYPDRVESYRTLRTVSTVGFIVGGVGTAVGVTLVLTSPETSPSETRRAKVGLRMTPGMAFVEGNF
jgi:hypothetical protein